VNPTPALSARPAPSLDDDQQRAWRQVVGLLMTLPSAIDGDLQRNAGLSFYDYLVLASLSETPNGMLQMNDLAHRANSSLSRLSHLISRLEKRGWVTKRPCDNDRRASTVVLTPVGEEKIVARLLVMHASSKNWSFVR
jgi:DNA-binding MarR family transcriptional regulator